MSPNSRTRRHGRSARLAFACVFAVLIIGLWPALARAAAPSVTGVAPTFGPAAGGTQVTIAGSGFTSDSSVAFGATTVTPTFLSSTELMATSPSGTGTVDITVTNQTGTSAAGTADEFTYDPVPAVTALSPRLGPPAGGTKITITGSGFTAGTSVTFGGVSVPVTVNSSTSLTVVSPGGRGTVDIVVITPGGSSITGPADQFTYGATPPTVTTGSATNVSQRSATVNGTVGTGGQTLTSCRFEYGPNTRFALSAACSSGRGTPRPVHARLTGLTPDTTYHYRLVATTTVGGTTTGPTMTFTTPSRPVVGAPRVGLLLSRVTHSQYIAELLGIQGINGGTVGQSLVLRCVAHCQHPLTTTIPLRRKQDLTRKIGLTRGLLVSKSTRIVIDLAARGRLSSYASYAFFISRGAIAVKVAKTGCILGTSIQKCPTAASAA